MAKTVSLSIGHTRPIRPTTSGQSANRPLQTVGLRSVWVTQPRSLSPSWGASSRLVPTKGMWCWTRFVAVPRRTWRRRSWNGNGWELTYPQMAKELVRLRLGKEFGLLSVKAVYRDDLPRRTDLGKLPPYRAHKHTLFGKQEGSCAECRHNIEFRNLTVDPSSRSEMAEQTISRTCNYSAERATAWRAQERRRRTYPPSSGLESVASCTQVYDSLS